MLEKIKRINRAFLELVLGIVFGGVVFQVAGAFLVEEIFKFSVAMWLGVVVALVSAVHLYRSLDRALSLGAGAYGATMKSAAIRYLSWTLFLGILMVTGILNPIHAFIGLLTLKVSAYIQPFTHKLCNIVFRETDPVAEAIPWDDEE